jgi:alcohol dehydrogenase
MHPAITTRLVDTVTTPMLLKLALSGKLDPSKLITHSMSLAECDTAMTNFNV